MTNLRQTSNFKRSNVDVPNAPSILRTCVLVGLLVTVALYPFFLRLDFTRSNYKPLDIVLMVSPVAWILLTFSCILLIFHVLLSKKFGLLHLFISILLFYGFFFVAQTPTPLQMDVLVHAGGAKEIVFNGNIQVRNSYVESWPGSFILTATFAEATGLEMIYANTALAVVAMMLSALVLYALGRKFVGTQWAGLPGLLYIVGNPFAFQLLDRDRLSPFNMAITLLFVSIFVLVLLFSVGVGRGHLAVLFVLVATMILSHVLVALLIVCIIVAMLFVKKLRPTSLEIRPAHLLTLLFFIVIIYLAWFVTFAKSTFERAVSIGAQIFTGGTPGKVGGVVNIASPSSLTLSNFLSYYYLRIVLVLVIVTSFLALIRYRKTKNFSFYVGIVSGTILFALVNLLIPAESGVTQWSRVLSLALLPMALVASIIMVSGKRRAKFAAIALIMLIIPSFLGSQSFLSIYVESVRPWEMNGFQFLSDHLTKPTFLEGDELIRAYASFYDLKNLTQAVDLSMVQINFTDRLLKYPNFFRGDTIVRSFRQDLRSLSFFKTQEEAGQFWRKVDTNINSDPLMYKEYDNGKLQIYQRLP